jgi:hypothetical protein
MTYEELLGYCQRTVGLARVDDGLHTILLVLQMMAPANRAIAGEALARFLVEYVEGQNVPAMKKPH